jgi:hypothetical protein
MERVIALRDGRVESDTLTDSDYPADESSRESLHLQDGLA